ncbi:MAG: O-antigen ligase family protein [Negativicutes bacterium]|nr:O-antigen ligase family protein [Negativicutes bacterium]
MRRRQILAVPPPRDALTMFNLLIERALLATVFFLPLSLTLTTVCLVAGSGLWLIRALYFRQRRLRVLAAEKAVVAYAVICLTTVVLSPEPAYSWYNYWQQFGRCLALYYLTINTVKTRAQTEKMLAALAAATLVVVVYGLIQYFTGLDLEMADWVDSGYFPAINARIFSTWLNPNLLAGYLLTMIALLAGAGLYERWGWRKVAALVLLAGCLLCLVLTWSRGGWLGLIIVILAIGLLRNRHLIWLAALILAVVVKTCDQAAVRLLSVLHPTLDSSSNMRLGIWSGTLAMIGKHPWWGWGWGTFRDYYSVYGYYVLDPGVIIYHAHNTYLHLLAETGVVGLAGFLAVAGLHGRLVWRKYRRTADRQTRGMLLGLLVALIGMLAAGFSDHLLFNIKMFMLFWLLCALAVVSGHN